MIQNIRPLLKKLDAKELCLFLTLFVVTKWYGFEEIMTIKAIFKSAYILPSTVIMIAGIAGLCIKKWRETSYLWMILSLGLGLSIILNWSVRTTSDYLMLYWLVSLWGIFRAPKDKQEWLINMAGTIMIVLTMLLFLIFQLNSTEFKNGTIIYFLIISSGEFFKVSKLVTSSLGDIISGNKESLSLILQSYQPIVLKGNTILLFISKWLSWSVIITELIIISLWSNTQRWSFLIKHFMIIISVITLSFLSPNNIFYSFLLLCGLANSNQSIVVKWIYVLLLGWFLIVRNIFIYI